MTKAPGKRSILASFASYTPQQSDKEEPDEVGPVPTLSSRVPGVIGATKRTLAEFREERDHLRALVDGGGEVDLDPELIDPSPFPDRLNDDNDAAFEAFKALIASEGQLLPILVRKHPSDHQRYQVAYGHRRLRAARELGLKVKAKIENLDDRQIAIAQGIENSARQDLTWAEKALFALAMEGAGIKARDIRASLAVDDPELARFRAVCRVVPEAVIRAIGRAPRAGRTRWVALSKACEDAEAVSRVRETLARAKVSNSDERFVLALDAASARAPQRASAIDVCDTNGRKLGTASFKPGEVKIVVKQSLAPGFSEFLQDELPVLVARYGERAKQ